MACIASTDVHVAEHPGDKSLRNQVIDVSTEAHTTIHIEAFRGCRHAGVLDEAFVIMGMRKYWLSSRVASSVLPHRQTGVPILPKQRSLFI